MSIHRAILFLQNTARLGGAYIKQDSLCRKATTTRSGAVLPEPKRARFGFMGVLSGVVVGLLIGATISKNMANFLEENDLFVPSDDDDDDD